MTHGDHQRPKFDVLLVEDNPSDVFLIQEACRGNRWINRLHVANSGDQAMAFLLRQGTDIVAPRPDLILLDIELPGMSGRELLGWIKAQPRLRCVPVLMLTSSDAESDRRACYELHANAYMTKGLNLDELQETLRLCTDYWFGIVKLPPL